MPTFIENTFLVHRQMARSTKRFIVTCMHSCSMVHVMHPAVYVYKPEGSCPHRGISTLLFIHFVTARIIARSTCHRPTTICLHCMHAHWGIITSQYQAIQAGRGKAYAYNYAAIFTFSVWECLQPYATTWRHCMGLLVFLNGINT